MNPRIALIQMVSSKSVEPNLKRVEQLVLDAAKADVQGIFLPENFAALGGDDPRKVGLAEMDSDGPVRSLVSELANRTGCWIFAGTCPTGLRPDGSEVPDGRVRAASLVYDDQGVEVGRYDKIHMFDVNVEDNVKAYQESMTFEPGEDVVAIDSPIGRVGLTVCYDIRFPELYRKLAMQNVVAYTVPSAFTEVTGEAHFELLMRARAVENQAFMIAACQGGVHDSGRRTHGHSMVVDPWGSVVAECSRGEDILPVELDLARQSELRASMPVLVQRRLDA